MNVQANWQHEIQSDQVRINSEQALSQDNTKDNVSSFSHMLHGLEGGSALPMHSPQFSRCQDEMNANPTTQRIETNPQEKSGEESVNNLTLEKDEEQWDIENDGVQIIDQKAPGVDGAGSSQGQPGGCAFIIDGERRWVNNPVSPSLEYGDGLMQDVEEGLQEYADDEHGEDVTPQKDPLQKLGSNTGSQLIFPHNLMTDGHTVSAERTLSIDQQIHVMKAQANEKFKKQSVQFNKLSKNIKMARILQARQRQHIKTGFELKCKDRISVPSNIGQRAKQIGFKQMFNQNGQKQSAQNARPPLLLQATFKNRIYPKNVNDNFEEFLDSQGSGVAPSASFHLGENQKTLNKKNLLASRQSSTVNGIATIHPFSKRGSADSSGPQILVQESRISRLSRHQGTLDSQSYALQKPITARNKIEQKKSRYGKRQTEESYATLDFFVLDSQRIRAQQMNGILPKYIYRNTTVFSQDLTPQSNCQDHNSLRRKTLIFLKLYELFYPGEYISQQKATGSVKLASESDFQYYKRQKGIKQEEKNAYLQFYQFMINVEKTLFHYQSQTDRIFIEDILDILTPETDLTTQELSQGQNLADSALRDEVSHARNRNSQFLHQFVRFRNGGQGGGSQTNSHIQGSRKREYGSKCPICTNQYFNEFLLDTQQEQNLSSEYFMGPTGVNQTYQNGIHISQNDIQKRNNNSNIRQEKFSKLIEMARFGSNKSQSMKSEGLTEQKSQGLSQFWRRFNWFKPKSQSMVSINNNDAEDDAPNVKVQFFGENQIIFHNQKMMKKLVKKELLSDIASYPKKRQQHLSSQSQEGDEFLDDAVPQPFKSAVLADKDDMLIAKQLNLSIIDEPEENHPIRIESDNKQDFNVEQAAKAHDYEDVGAIRENHRRPPDRNMQITIENEQSRGLMATIAFPNEMSIEQEKDGQNSQGILVSDSLYNYSSVQPVRAPIIGEIVEKRKERARQMVQTLGSVAPERDENLNSKLSNIQSDERLNPRFGDVTAPQQAYNENILYLDQLEQQKRNTQGVQVQRLTDERSVGYRDSIVDSPEHRAQAKHILKRDETTLQAEPSPDLPTGSLTLSYRDKTCAEVFKQPHDYQDSQQCQESQEPQWRESVRQMQGSSTTPPQIEDMKIYRNKSVMRTEDESGAADGGQHVVVDQSKEQSNDDGHMQIVVSPQFEANKYNAQVVASAQSNPFLSINEGLEGSNPNGQALFENAYRDSCIELQDQSRQSALRSRGLFSIENNENANRAQNIETNQDNATENYQLNDEKLIDLNKESIQQTEPIFDPNSPYGQNHFDKIALASRKSQYYNQGSSAPYPTLDQARESRKDSQQFVEYTEIYGDVENCDLCGEVFERHHRDFNLEINLRIEHMRQILNQTQKDQTLVHSLLQSRNGSVPRKIDFVQNKNTQMNSGKEIILFKHVTTLNSPQGTNHRQSLFFPVPKDTNRTPMNKNQHASQFDQQQMFGLQNNTKNFLTKVNEEDKEANTNEHAQLGKIRNKFDDQLMNRERSNTSKNTSSLMRKRRLDPRTINKMDKEVQAMKSNFEIHSASQHDKFDQELQEEIEQQNEDVQGEVEPDDQKMSINLSTRLQAFNRSKSTQLTAQALKNQIRNPHNHRLTIQIDQEALTSLKKQARENYPLNMEKHSLPKWQQMSNTLENGGNRGVPFDQNLNEGLALRLKWKEKLKELEPYYDNNALCQLCFNEEVQNPSPNNNLCDQCITRLNKMHEAEVLGCDQVGFQDASRLTDQCHLCGLQQHYQPTNEQIQIQSKGYAIDEEHVYREVQQNRHRTENLCDAGHDEKAQFAAAEPDNQMSAICQNHLRTMYTKIKLKQFRHLYEYCQSSFEQQEILQQAQQFQFCLCCDRVIRKYGALRCQHLTCHHCNITFCMYCREIIFYQKWTKKKDKRIAQHGLQLLKDHFNPFSLNSCKMMSGTKNYQSYKEQTRIRENIQSSLNYSQISFDKHMDLDRNHQFNKKNNNEPLQSYKIPILQYLNDQARKIAIQGDPEYIHTSVLNIQNFSNMKPATTRCIFLLFCLLWLILGVPLSIIAYFVVATKTAYNSANWKEKECYYLQKKASNAQKCCTMLTQIIKFIVLFPLFVPAVFMVVMVGFHGLLNKLARRSLE